MDWFLWKTTSFLHKVTCGLSFPFDWHLKCTWSVSLTVWLSCLLFIEKTASASVSETKFINVNITNSSMDVHILGCSSRTLLSVLTSQWNFSANCENFSKENAPQRKIIHLFQRVSWYFSSHISCFNVWTIPKNHKYFHTSMGFNDFLVVLL